MEHVRIGRCRQTKQHIQPDDSDKDDFLPALCRGLCQGCPDDAVDEREHQGKSHADDWKVPQEGRKKVIDEKECQTEPVVVAFA